MLKLIAKIFCSIIIAPFYRIILIQHNYFQIWIWSNFTSKTRFFCVHFS